MPYPQKAPIPERPQNYNPRQVEHFLAKATLPAERDLVRRFIQLTFNTTGHYPMGNSRVEWDDGHAGFMGRTIDFSSLASRSV